jgi:hypothetical protein
MAAWLKIVGTQANNFRLGLLGVRIKDLLGNLSVRNTDDTADAEVTAAKFNASGDTGLVINSDSTSTGTDWKISVARPTTGMAADWTLTLPPTSGSPNQVLVTDGTGVTTWHSPSSTTASWSVDNTSFTFGSSSPVPMFTLPANAVIDSVIVIVDTVFDGTPSLSVGVSGGSASKYVSASDVNLKVADRYEVPNQSIPVAVTEDLEIAFVSGGSSVGAGRVLVTYAVPT